MFRVLRRVDDLVFLEQLFDYAVNIIVVPKRNLVVFWSRSEVEHDRVTGCRKTRNGLYICRARLSL